MCWEVQHQNPPDACGKTPPPTSTAVRFSVNCAALVTWRRHGDSRGDTHPFVLRSLLSEESGQEEHWRAGQEAHDHKVARKHTDRTMGEPVRKHTDHKVGEAARKHTDHTMGEAASNYVWMWCRGIHPTDSEHALYKELAQLLKILESKKK